MATKTFKIGLSNTDKQNMAQDVYERLLALTFPEYDTTTSYDVGDFVVYNDQLYKCIGATSGAWDSSKWQLATLNDLLTDIEDAVAFVNDKANVDGNYPTMTVGVADQLSPYDDESGDDQDEPFSFQATGTGNGSQPDFSTGAIALMKEKQGNTVVVNQLAKELNTTNYYAVNGSLAENSGVLTYTVTTSVGFFDNSIRQDSKDTGNHKLWLYCVLKASSNLKCGIAYNGATIYKDCTANTKETIVGIGQGFTTYPLQVGIETAPQVGDTLEVYEIKVIDLTQWFNGDIPQDLLDNPENFFRYYQGDLSYNTGELVNANGRYIKCIGRNQWDKSQVVANKYVNPNTGLLADSNNHHATGFIRVNPNSTYHLYLSDGSTGGGIYGAGYSSASESDYVCPVYLTANGNVEIPSNVLYIRFTLENAQVDRATFSIYYEGESGYDQYYPYEVLTNNDTGTEVLRSAGSVHDIKLPSGEIKRNVGYVDLGTLTWEYSSADGQPCFHITNSLDDTVSVPFFPFTLANIICSKYTNATWNDNRTQNGFDKTIAQGGRTISIRDSAYNDAAAFKTAMSGVYLFYELAEPTTEQGTPFSENLVIDDFGSMDFQGTNGVPQGNLIFYPVDYKAFIDTLYDYTEGTPSNIALKSDLASDKSELQGVDTQLLNAIGGTLRQCLCVKESLDFEDTDFVDLGSLTWYYTDGRFFAGQQAYIKGSVDNDTDGIMLCTKYNIATNNETYANTKVGVSINPGSYLAIYDPSAGTDATVFKNAMKGVLLAYEKASS